MRTGFLLSRKSHVFRYVHCCSCGFGIPVPEKPFTLFLWVRFEIIPSSHKGFRIKSINGLTTSNPGIQEPAQVVAASVRPHVMSFNLSIEVKKSLFVK